MIFRAVCLTLKLSKQFLSIFPVSIDIAFKVKPFSSHFNKFLNNKIICQIQVIIHCGNNFFSFLFLYLSNFFFHFWVFLLIFVFCFAVKGRRLISSLLLVSLCVNLTDFLTVIQSSWNSIVINMD
jgi:hypothetical protein